MEGRIVSPACRPGRPLDLGLAPSRTPHLQSLLGPAPENHRAVLYPDDRVLAFNPLCFRGLSFGSPLHGVARSSAYTSAAGQTRIACNPTLRPAAELHDMCYSEPLQPQGPRKRIFCMSRPKFLRLKVVVLPFAFHRARCPSKGCHRPTGRVSGARACLADQEAIQSTGEAATTTTPWFAARFSYL